MVEYRQTKTLDSSTTALWQSYKQPSNSKQEERAKEMNLALQSISDHSSKVIFYIT
jgi:hypothetical protein